MSFSFFMHSLLKEKKPEAKRQKGGLYIGSGRVGSGQGVPGTGRFHGQRHQMRRRVRMSRAAAAASLLLARSFFVDPSSSRALVAFRVFVAGPVCSPCFPLCTLEVFSLSVSVPWTRVRIGIQCCFCCGKLVCSSHRSTVSGIDSVLPFSMPVASFVALMRVDDQLLLFLFLSHVVVSVVQQFHVQTCSALHWFACFRRIPLSLWIFSICYCSGPKKLVASAQQPPEGQRRRRIVLSENVLSCVGSRVHVLPGGGGGLRFNLQPALYCPMTIVLSWELS